MNLFFSFVMCRQRNAKNPRDIDITIGTQLDGPTPKYVATKSYRLR
jgi:hypothetical protein